MGTIILVIVAIIEIVLAGWCIATKSRQKRVRSWVRIGMLGAFVLFTTVGVIIWSFRWVMLAIALLIMAFAGTVSLLRKIEGTKKFGVVSTVFKAVAVWLAILLSVTPALVFPQYRLPAVTGEMEVKTAIFTFTDNSRKETFVNTGENRKVTVEFWYPANVNGKFPLVVFSHGAFGIMASNTSTFNDLASNGYVVCSVSHPYHSMFTRDTDGKMTLVDSAVMQEVVDANNGAYSEEEIFALEQKWMKTRTDDLNFVLDTILKKAAETEKVTAGPETAEPVMEVASGSSDGTSGNSVEAGNEVVFGLVDTGRIGLMGHSLGGAASAQLGRDRSDVDAVIDIDGGLLGEYTSFRDGMPVANTEVYPLPILGIFTDAMKEAMKDSIAATAGSNVVIAEKQVFENAPEAFEVYFAGTNHMSVTDLPLFSPFLVNMINGTTKKNGGEQIADRYEVIETMNRIILEFFDCYLKDKGSFQSVGTYLQVSC